MLLSEKAKEVCGLVEEIRLNEGRWPTTMEVVNAIGHVTFAEADRAIARVMRRFDEGRPVYQVDFHRYA